jgi:hypothetical protein
MEGREHVKQANKLENEYLPLGLTVVLDAHVAEFLCDSRKAMSSISSANTPHQIE